MYFLETCAIVTQIKMDDFHIPRNSRDKENQWWVFWLKGGIGIPGI